MGAVKEPVATLYDTDFAAWAQQQADALRARQLDRLDYDNLIEEIESMGKQQQAELVSRLAVLLAHLLKWQHQSATRSVHGRSWQLTVKEQRRQVERHVRRNPSLQSYVVEAMSEGYGDALVIAARDSDLSEDEFPRTCPWRFDQLMTIDWMPE